MLSVSLTTGLQQPKCHISGYSHRLLTVCILGGFSMKTTIDNLTVRLRLSLIEHN